jgi:hypothetical protein
VFIRPITVQLLVYGQKANVASIRTRATAFLKDEHGKADPACFTEAPAAEVHAAILACRYDDGDDLKKPTPAQAGLKITLPEVHARMVGEWLQELPVAKTCVVLAAWDNPREGRSEQLLIVEGLRSSEHRELKADAES